MIKHYILVLLFLTTICYGKIEISIKTSNLRNETNIRHYGSDIKQVTDQEVQLFNITNDNLSRGVRVEMGKAPNEVFLKDPTVYGEVFKKHKWPDVKRKLGVKNIRIVELIKQNVVLKRFDHINNSTINVTSKKDVIVPITNTMTAIWNEKGLPEDDIKYNIEIDFGYGKVSQEALWRDNNTFSFDLSIRKSKGVIEIPSGQGIVSKLLAEKVILLIEIDMNAYLIGNIVVNYEHTYGKYHLWAPTIGNIMKAAKIKNELSTKVLLEIRYYTNARLEVKDKNTGKEIRTIRKKPKRKLTKPVYKTSF